MKIVLINHNPDYEERFKNYVKKWEFEKMKPDEDYSGMYKRVFEDYSDFIDHLISLRDLNRLKENKPYVRFYWFVNEIEEIIGTIRFRTNIPEEYGNVGYEIAPEYRSRGYGKKMLRLLLNELKLEGIKSGLLSLSEENISSQKVIEHNGGNFVKKIQLPEKVEVLNVFEIVL